ncbi:MAG TPA: hypothetical protein VH877_24080 [Polyangia bacterium]|jgi:hypothetical protein|nr:hypothetical protein [Polyangia bacterium]
MRASRSPGRTRPLLPRSLVLLTALALALALVPGGGRPAEAKPAGFKALFRGTFAITMSGDGKSQLHFEGQGTPPRLGASAIVGDSSLTPNKTNPACSMIETDRVSLTVAGGDEIHFVHQGEDCVDTSHPPEVTIRSKGTYRIVGGTGRFARATGQGRVTVLAKVLEPGPTGSRGSFELTWDGTLKP